MEHIHVALAELLGKRLSPIGLTGRTLTWTVRVVGLIPTWGKSVFPSNGCMMDIYIYYCMFISRELNFIKRCLCLYLLVQLAAL